MPILLKKLAMNNPTPSPCTSVCNMDAHTGYCKGCYRTVDEIMRWGQGSEAFKQAVWQQLHQRHAQLCFPEAAHNKAFVEGV
ncbi:MAG: DUF1289 domain-containing protein [Brachymonas sp.]|nr:DUF1289 domain-containing protein [Brachymonas sp.]